MASTNSTSNIIVGAAAVAIGTGTPTVAGVDATFLGIRGAASGTPKNRTYPLAQPWAHRSMEFTSRTVALLRKA